MKILNSSEIETFESPPIFSTVERNNLFSFSALKDIVETFRTPTNKVCFIVMLGYFKTTNKFFSRRFHKKDVEFVTENLGIPIDRINVDSYDKQTYNRHRIIIMEYCGFIEFSNSIKQIVTKEISSMVRSQLRPRFILLQVLEILRRKKIEIPSYNILANLIVGEINHHRRRLSKVIEHHLTDDCRQLLDALFEKGGDEHLKVKRYKLTLLKKISQSTKPKKIKESIQDHQILKEIFQNLGDIVPSLDLTHEGFKYYANSVIKSEIFQISRRSDEDRYLHLITFIVHQYYKLQDTLIDIFMNSIQSILNSSNREHKEKYYEERHKRNKSINDFIDYLDKNIITLSNITTIVNSPDLSDTEKIELIKPVLSEDESHRDKIEEELSHIKKTSKSTSDADFYSILESKSLKLQNRVSEIVKHVEFNQETSCPKIMAAIKQYKLKNGTIEKNAPIGFLDLDEQGLVFDNNGKFRVSLYKVLLFIKIADAIKAGTLNLKDSYKYRSLDEYLISKTVWRENIDEFLRRSDLVKFADYKNTLLHMKSILDDQHHKTNQDILKGENNFISFYKNGSFKIQTPKVETGDFIPLVDFLPNKHYISLSEVLSIINKTSGFLDAFEHWQVKYNRPKPPDRTFWAGIIGYGCNIGIKKIAKISKQINESELENTINWYFSVDNVTDANDKILGFMDQLYLPNIYRKKMDSLHTSSDGQKFNVPVDSLNANYSFKYFGKDKGASVYSFIDERDFLFHSNVISASEREAAYVIDGLMHNDVVKSDIHSTDTHGYSEIIFGVMYLLGFAFAPRIKNLKRRSLYSFEKRKIYEKKGYKILPDAYINTKLIEANWDEILRFIATIKLKETTASQLFRRLNSYSKQHPLYKSLKEFGKIVKTIFILQYISDVEIRQAIMKMMNKIEHSHRFAKAVSFGNNQEFLQGEVEEQNIAEGCRRLIENAIICWNYLFLSQKIVDETNEDQKKEFVKTIKNGSIVTWKHINLHGEYDFSEEKLQDSIGLRIHEIVALQLS